MGTGAATIFGTTGGVAEAVARRVVEDKSRNTLQLFSSPGFAAARRFGRYPCLLATGFSASPWCMAWYM